MLALKNTVKRYWLALLLLPVASLFFIGGPNGVAAPFLRYAWNMGHIAFFVVATVAYSHFRPFKSTLQVFYYLASVLILSFIIEGAQSTFGRSMSTMDILRNLIGCALALWFVARPFLHISVISFLSFVLAIDLAGLAAAGYTDFLIQTRKPIVEDFESEFSIARWNGNLVSSTEHVFAGQYSGKVIFLPSKYPTVMLFPTLQDWTGYTRFEMTIFNPENEPMDINIRLHDKMHALSSAQQYNDRFNAVFELQSGWNTLSYRLEDIQNAPTSRAIDMNAIYALGLFLHDTQSTTELYFDEFILR